MNGNHGGARPGAGRKPKAEEIAMAEKMDKIGDTDEIYRTLYRLAREGSEPAIKLWLAYRDGMPKQTIDQNTTGEQTITVIREGDSYPPIIHSPSGTEADIRE